MITPRTASTVWALRTSGGRNAGVPSETASIPVRATAPDAKARRSRNTPSSASGGGGGAAASTGGRPQIASPANPYSDHQDVAADEEIAPHREHPPGLAETPQVRHRDEHDEADAEHDAVRVQERETPR